MTLIIPYDYTLEVRNKFKGLDLIESLMNYGQRFMTLYRRQGSRPSPRKRNAKKQNGCRGGLTNSCEKKGSKKQRGKGKIYPFECRVPPGEGNGNPLQYFCLENPMDGGAR